MSTGEMFRSLPFPFEGGVFPASLGAVVQRSVLDGEQPAREVTHWADGSWTVGDGMTDPNAASAAVATHIWHAVQRNSSIASLANMAPGHIAKRDKPGEQWQIFTFEED